jgi:hypothetical protein
MGEGPVPTLQELITHDGGSERASKKRVRFTYPDLDYLVGRTGYEPRFIAQLLRKYGAKVVTEALRRAVEAEIKSPEYFVGMCKRVLVE